MIQKLGCVLLCFGLFGCLQAQNSNSLDDMIYGAAITGSPEFLAAAAVMSRSCVPCHSFHGQSEAQLEAQGLVVAGNAQGSRLYYRLANSAGSGGPKNMPPSGAISNGDLDTIKTWIDNM